MNSRIADALRAVLASDAVRTDVEVVEEYAYPPAMRRRARTWPL